MLHCEELRQLTHDRGRQIQREASAERLARQARGRTSERKLRWAVAAALELLLPARRPA